MKSSGPQVSGRPSARPASCVQAQLGGMKKALAPASKQDTRATLTGSWTLYHGPFSLSIRAAGWGKIAVGSSSGKAPSGCCDPRKAGEFGAENNRVRHRFPGVRHRLAEAGEAAFLSCSMMGDTATGKGPFHARATPQNPARKKEIRRETLTIKKTLPPRSEKSRLFPLGFTRGVPGHCGEIIPRPRANCRKRPHRKKSGKHRGLYTMRPYTKKIIVYHEGISLPLYAGKVCETGHIKKAENAFTLPAFLNSTTGSAAACSSRSRTGRG